jgi:hypothetical protein
MALIGQMRHRLVVENPTASADGDGGYSDSYAAAAPSPVWASVEPATPGVIEQQVGNRIEAPITHIVTLRYHAGVTTRTRFTFGSRRLFVRGLQKMHEVGEWLVCSCEEFV